MEEYEQCGLFDEEYPKYEIQKKIRLIELFAGVGSQSMALKRMGVDFESYKAVEFDEFAMKSYNSIHDTNFPTMDITKTHASDLEIVDKDKYEYIMFYSFPCTDLSLAGRQAGMSRDSGTRSGLLWEVERLLKELPKEQLPDVLIMENVPQVHSEKNLPDFEDWIDFLRKLGYSNFWQDLNAKDFGVPQNRDRCFMISMLGDYEYQFPRPIPLEKVIVDVLEDEVDEKFFIRSEKAKLLIDQLIKDGKIEE
ncbi:MAG: DNA (cytosine-5-)-methyltransferase [Methanobrevibacter sp.]|nr:DNA (cytosine-5-)-methyltransferase [Methanobrevibacter sp.]MBP5785379.1 DNA (cytosine-5-)-methyltransferase [Methanobrevibacter sp.]